VARILSAIEQAKRDSSDLIVFPEVTIQATPRSIGSRSGRSSIGARSARKDHSGHRRIDGDRRHRAPNDRETGPSSDTPPPSFAIAKLSFCRQDPAAGIRRVRRSRYSNLHMRPFNRFRSNKVGIAVCEDFVERQDFLEAATLSERSGAELIELGAQCWCRSMPRLSIKARWASVAKWFSHRARMANLPIVFVNLVGGNDGVTFDGAVYFRCDRKNHFASAAIRRIHRDR